MIYRRGGRGLARRRRRDKDGPTVGTKRGGEKRGRWPSRTDPQRDEGVRASVNPARSIVAN